MMDELAQYRRGMAAFDAFLYRGDDDPHTRALLAVAYVLDRMPSRQAFVEAYDRASRLVLRLRQRVVDPPTPLFLPAWIVDPDFDLDHHLRFARLPGSGSMADLLDVVQEEVTAPLDSARPLWEALLLEGLEGGRAAVVMKMSHAITDGIGALDLFSALIDTTRRPDKGPMPPVPVPQDVTPEELLWQELAGWPAAAWQAVRAGLERLPGSLWRAPRLRHALGEAAGFTESLGRVLGPHGTPSPLLAGRSLRRRCAALEIPLADFRRTAKRTGGSVNDVYLAGVAAAMRRYHEALGTPAQDLPLAIPVNLRRGDDPAAGNHFGAILLAAPVGVKDPVRRIARVREAVRAGRAEPAIGALGAMAPVLARLPAAARRALAARSPKPDIQASNVPGPTRALYLAGARILRSHAFGPVPGVAAMFTLQSIAGTCFIGIHYDPAAITDGGRFARSLTLGFRETLRPGNPRPRIGPVTLGRRDDMEMTP
jgi:diacylglycerol O-acyltransferase